MTLSSAPCLFLLVAACIGLSGCDPVTMGLVTAGGGVAVNRQIQAMVSRTFCESSADVHSALLAALDRMSVSVKEIESEGTVERVSGTAGHRSVSIRVEPVTKTSTLVEVSVRENLLTLDAATAREIVAQTEQSLGKLALAKRSTENASLERGQAAGGVATADRLPGRTTYYGYDASPEASRPRNREAAPAKNSTPPARSGNTNSQLASHVPATAAGSATAGRLVASTSAGAPGKSAASPAAGP